MKHLDRVLAGVACDAGPRMAPVSRSLARACAIALAAAALAGCEARIEQLTTPPPGAVIEVDVDDDSVVLTRGAAVAIACYQQGPCSGLEAESDDPQVAFARRAWQDDLAANGVDGQASREAVVIAGLAEGETTVRLTWSDGELDVRVVVEPR